jgi:hypothetical protein
LGNIEVPVSEDYFRRLGVSTTPTMALVDSNGIVRMYHPGAATYDELATRLDAMLKPANPRVTSATQTASH